MAFKSLKFQDFFIVESALSLSSWFTGPALKYLETNNSNTNITGLKKPTGRRQPVGYLQAWPRIWTRDDGEQIQQVARVGFEPETAGLRVRRADHSRAATLPPWRQNYNAADSSPVVSY